MTGMTFLTCWLICYGVLATAAAVMLTVLLWVSVRDRATLVGRVLRGLRDELDLTPADRERFTDVINRNANPEVHDE